MKKRDNKRVTITRTLKKLKIGSNVVVKLEPSVQKGMPHPRYHGVMGKIIEKRGKSYLLSIKDHNKEKTLISMPEHIKELEISG